MRIHPTVATVLGAISENHWSQALTLDQADVLVEVGDETGNARERGMQILSFLTQKITTELVRLDEVVKLADAGVEKGALSVVIMVPVGQTVYLALSGGGGSAYLKRGNHIACLVNQKGSVSGEIAKGDVLLLVTAGLTSVLPKDKLTQIFDHLSPAEAAEKLTLLVHQTAPDAPGVALIWQATQLVAVEEEEPQERSIRKIRQIVLPEFTRRHLVQIREGLRRRLAFNPLRLREILRRIGRKRLTALAIVFSLAAILIISITAGLNKQVASRSTAELDRVMAEAQFAFDEGVALRDLNPVSSRKRLTEAKELLLPLTSRYGEKTSGGRKLQELFKQVTDNLTIAMQIHQVQPELFYDLSLLKKDARGSGMSFFQDTLGVIDGSTRTAYSLTVSPKKGLLLGGGDFIAPKTLVAVSPDYLFVLSDKNISKLPQDGSGERREMIKNSDWGQVIKFTYYLGNLYLLDATTSRVWKYVGTGNGFSEKREYLNPDTLPDLSKSTGLAIDGSVWVSTSDGKIIKFTQGKEVTFVPTGVEPALGANLRIFTDDNCSNLYVLDETAKRIVVLTKEGQYVAQYVWEKPTPAEDFAVSETQKKVLLMSGGLFYAFDLK